jgi:hypothetical protein
MLSVSYLYSFLRKIPLESQEIFCKKSSKRGDVVGQIKSHGGHLPEKRNN